MKKLPLVPIFVTICLDFVSLGVVIPILAPLILKTDLLLPSTFTLEQKTITLGFLIGIFPLASFFGSPILGAWSDRIGRKKVLIFSLCITFLSYIIFALGITYSFLWLLFVSRLLGGLGGANINTCVASMVDVTKPEDRVKNFGLLGVASFAFGYVLGPIIGGIFSDSSIVSWFNNSTPFYFISFWTLLNLALVLFFFPETLHIRSKDKLTLFSGIINIFKIFKLPRYRSIFLTIFLITFGFNFFDQFFQAFLVQKFNFTISQIAILFAQLGIWMAVTQGLIVRGVARKLTGQTVLTIALPCLAILFPLLLFPNQAFFLYLLIPLIAIFQGLAWPFSTSLISQMTDEKSQGEILGINSSLQGLAMGLPPILAGFFAALNINLPIIIAGFCALLAWVIFVFWFKFKKN